MFEEKVCVVTTKGTFLHRYRIVSCREDIVREVIVAVVSIIVFRKLLVHSVVGFHRQ